ncbi:MAG: replicative DNA helicase [Pseudohongiellaceae bacterium]|jgi:replicative DNA helicase
MQEPASTDKITALKVPPHSIEAEQAVLGALMLDDSRWDAVSEILLPGDFYRKEHQLLFDAMQRQASVAKPIDVLTLSETLRSNNQLKEAGDVDYLGELVGGAHSGANIVAYAQIIKERAILRKLISTAHRIADSGYNPDGRSSAELLEEAEQHVYRIADERTHDGGPLPVTPILKSAVERIEQLFHAKGNITGLSTGFKDMDEMTSGLQPSDLVIVAGRPSMGKTTFAMNMVEHAVLHNDKPVLVFSLEMPADSLIIRMLSSIGKIDQTRMRNGKLENEDWDKLTVAVSRLRNRPLFIDDSSGLSPGDMRGRARRLVREHGPLGMIMVDYLQLMQIKGSNENRTGEISEISRSLKLMAREFCCPVVALSQLNRSLEQRPNKRPVMSDLRESGAIEQDADVIMFVYRHEVYEPDKVETKGMAEIIIGKQRNGPIGAVNLSFIGKHTRFADYTPMPGGGQPPWAGGE